MNPILCANARRLLWLAGRASPPPSRSCRLFCLDGVAGEAAGAFEGPLFVMDMQPRRNYTSAVRDNVLAGGDNCSRAAFLAACFAAQVGSHRRWKGRCRHAIRSDEAICRSVGGSVCEEGKEHCAARALKHAERLPVVDERGRAVWGAGRHGGHSRGVDRADCAVQ